MVQDGAGDYSPAWDVAGTVTASRDHNTARDTTATETYASGVWQATAGQGGNSQSSHETDTLSADGNWTSPQGDASGTQSYDGVARADSDLSTGLMIDDSGAWTVSGGSADSSFSGNVDHSYDGGGSAALIGGYLPGSTTLERSGSDDLSFSFNGTASVDDTGSLSWSGAGDAQDSSGDSAGYSANASYTNDSDYDSSSRHYVENYQETASSNDASEVSTDYTMTPAGDWKPVSSDAINSGSASASGTDSYENDLSNNENVSTQVYTWVDSSQSQYAGSIHAQWDNSGAETVSGSATGQGSQDMTLTLHSNSDDGTTDGYSDQIDGQLSTAVGISWTKDYPGGSIDSTPSSSFWQQFIETDVTSSGTSVSALYDVELPYLGVGYGRFPTNPLGGSWSYYSPSAPDPSTAAAGAGQAGLAGLAVMPMASVPNVADAPAPLIIQVQIAQPIAHTTNSIAPGNSPAGAGNGGFSYSGDQLSGSWLSNFSDSLFAPSGYGSAGQVTTPQKVKNWQTGLNIAGGGLIGVGAGLAVAGYIGEAAAATWGGTFAVNVAGGAAGSFFQNAATQAEGNQPFSFTQLAESTTVGAALGGAGGVFFKGLGAAIKGVAGWASDALSGVAGEEASNAASEVGDAALPRPDGCFVARTLVRTAKQREPITQIALGRRILAGPGEAMVSGPPRDSADYRIIRLLYIKPGGSGQRIELSLLRHASRAENLGPGDTVRLDVLELEIQDMATVLAIEPAPPIEEGPGTLVTGTIRTTHADVRWLKLVGLEEPVGVTANHPIFSEDEQDFVPVSTLSRGDRLRTRSGEGAVVESITSAGSHEVFNLEVEELHQYYVSELEVLAHNAGDCLTGISAKGNPIADYGAPRAIQPGAIGVGLDAQLGELSRSGASTYKSWFRDGLTRIAPWMANLDSYAFQKAFTEAATNAKQIVVDLAGVDINQVLENGADGFVSHNYTNAEISMILNNTEWLAKTIFFNR